MVKANLRSEFLEYLATYPSDQNENDVTQLPSLSLISEQLGVSVACLREQLEVTKALGLVEVRPRTGIRRLSYSFSPAVQQSLAYAISLDWSNFSKFSDLRNHIESAYWLEAAEKLTDYDHQKLIELMLLAWKKLKGNPIQIPHKEHRELHLTIFKRLENTFVQGLLEAYWVAYEAVGLDLYADYGYLEQVWNYHQQIVDAICLDDLEKGYQALVAHKDLLFHRQDIQSSR
jgi:DNA-binding FadR family transcriptional regulator